MATVASRGIKDFVFEWEGKDRSGKIVRAAKYALREKNQVKATLRRRAFCQPRSRSAPDERGQKDQAQRHRAVHAPDGHDDEGRRSAASGI